MKQETDNHLIAIKELKAEVSDLWHDFNQFSKLYDSGQGTLDLLTNTAPVFFRDIHLFYCHMLIIGISRITDTYENKRKKEKYYNLTLDYLLKYSKKNKLEIEKDLELALNKVNKSAEPIRKARNKWIAHRDYDFSCNLPRNKFDGLDIENIKQTLIDIESFMNVYHKSQGAQVLYHMDNPVLGVDMLLNNLRDKQELY